MNAAATMWSRYSAKNVTKRELSALKTALAIGHLLNRVVILPRFHCGLAHSECPLNSLIHIKTFDSVFSGQYRENSFLRHPKVPDSVKQGVTDLHINQTSSTAIRRWYSAFIQWRKCQSYKSKRRITASGYWHGWRIFRSQV